MAIFSNQATLTVGGVATASNIAFGEILEALTVTKTAVEASFAPGSAVTYVVNLRNTGATPLTDLTFTDNLGAYTLGANTVYPLSLVETDVALFVGGVLQSTPNISAGPPLTVTGITIPAATDAVLVYQATVNGFANPAAGSTINNTVTVTGGGLTTPITATESITAATAPQLSIEKSISPTQVVENDRVTYTFVIRNTGNQAITAADAAVITDTFQPVLTDLAVTFNGAPWAEGTNYTYTEATGQFATAAGQIVVPAANYTQNPVTGEFTVIPGTATLVVTGTI